MSDQIKFCYQCGANLPEGAVFCPECGASIDGKGPERVEYTATPVRAKKDALGPVPIITLIYGVVAVLGAIFTIILGITFDAILDMLDQMVKNGTISESDYQRVWDLAHSFGSMTIQVVFTAIGLLLAISGILAIFAGSSAGDLKNWRRTVVLYGIASLVPAFMVPFDILLAIILPAVGLIMTFIVYKHKDDFIS